MSSPLDMRTMNNGGVVEAVNIALAKVADNIADVNTPQDKPRTVTLKITFKPDESRTLISSKAVVTTNLQPQEPQTIPVVLDKLLVHVCDVTAVRVMSVPFGGWKQRTTYMRADAVIPAHRFGSWTSPDEFVPYLQSCFVPSDDLDALIKISGNLVDTSEVRVQDDGVSQEVSIRQGAARKAEVPVPSPAVVFPFSTFAEVAQPAHKVVFRLQSSPLACKLIECDGGAWKLEAIANIRTWLLENLPEGVKVIA